MDRVKVLRGDGSATSLVIENEAGACISVTLVAAASGKLSSMLLRALESQQYSGTLELGSDVTVTETVKKVLR